MRIFNKLVCMCLILCVGFSMVFTGCGKQAKEETGKETVKEQENKDTKVDNKNDNINKNQDKEVKLKAVFIGPGKQKDSDMVWKEFNNELQGYLPNTEVDFEIISTADYLEKWKLMAASNTAIDVAWTGWLIPYVDEIQRGSYMELDDLIKENAPNLLKELPDFVWEKAKVNGKIYSVPCYQMMTLMRCGVRLHKDIADKYLDYDKVEQVMYSNDTMTEECWDALEPYLAGAKKDGKIHKGVSTVTLEWMSKFKGFDPIGDQNSIAMFKVNDNDLKVFNKYETKEMKTFYKKMAEWFEKGYIREDILSVQNPRQDDGKPDGQIMWVHDFLKGYEENESKRYGFPIKIVPIQDYHYIPSHQSSTSLTIPKTSNHPVEAIKLIDLLNTKKGEKLYNLLTYGLEGTHYEKVSDNRIETKQAGQGAGDTPYGLWKWAIGNTMNCWETQTDVEGWNDYIENDLHKNAKESLLIGFKLDPKPIKTQLAQIQTVIGEYENVLISGALPNWEEYYNQFVEKLKKAGCDEVIAEYQKQVDEYAKSNGIK